MYAKVHSSVVCLSLVLVAVTGCQVGPRVQQPMRAIWVTRGDYRSADDVVRIMDNCQQAGFNTVVFQVRGNGTAFYQSNLEPWADELGGQDPGWDPLGLACNEGHARGMQVHAWVNVMPAWQGRAAPANPEQLYSKHPDWFWYDATGARQPLVHTNGQDTRPWYVSVNPCLPEVRAYLVEVFRDLVARYPVDGLHMDYIRFPNEPVVSGEKIPDYPRDARTLELYRQATGKGPDDDPNAWKAWRTECVTTLVRDIHDMLRVTKPEAVLTASVGTSRGAEHFRDDRRWVREKLLDAAFPMNYTDSADTFAKRIDSWLEDKPAVPLVPGLWFGRHPGKSPEEVAAAVRQQIEIAREKTGNFCLFSYASLFDTHPGNAVTPDPEATTQATTQMTRAAQRQSAKAIRREVLVPYLAGLAGE